MNIEFKNNRGMCFSQLEAGDIFRLSYGSSTDIFMKIERLEISKESISKVGFPVVNAVYLSDKKPSGAALYFSDNLKVEKFEKPKLVLE